MRGHRCLPSLAALLLVAGCGEGTAPSAPARADTAALLQQQKARIDALAEGQRNAVFLRAIRDGEQNCQQVVGSAYYGEQSGRPSWAARCADGRDWIIIVEANGRALVAPRPSAPEQR